MSRSSCAGSQLPSASIIDHDSACAGEQTGVAGGTVAASAHLHHSRSMIARDRLRAVGRAVVRDDHPDPRWNPRQQPAQAVGLVEARQDQLDLGSPGTAGENMARR